MSYQFAEEGTEESSKREKSANSLAVREQIKQMREWGHLKF